uniref:Calponin-homology (CH) domain-containing protein n=1 Tax=Poecilia mexicana TaxID=48701 RepID=A0A3B3WW73_9TELE
MSDILCSWLNRELRLSETVGKNVSKDFSNGYLFGEILHKYQMQEDFHMFLKSDSSNAKANNFSRLEPSFKLLGVSFNKSTAQDLMKEKHGVATNLLYQLYVALEEKKPAGISRVVKLPTLQKRESEIHSNVRTLNKCVRYFAVPEVRVVYLSFIFIIFSPSDQSIPVDSSLSAVIQETEVPADKPDKVALQSNTKYIQGIRQQLKESAVAREERQKRVDRFLMEQYKARESQQEAQLEEQMVRRLTRQTQQEQRLAEQLMQIRRQKEVILENRLFREEQYRRQREKDFREALDKEAVLAEHAKLARAEEIEKEIEFCKMVAAERALEKHLKHYGICSEILGQMVDMAITAGEYRHITENLVPEKKYKEWKELFIQGVPFYEPQEDIDPSEVKKEEVLNNLDYDEYTNMVGVWMWSKDIEETKLPPSSNDILAYAIHRIKNIAHPTVVEPATTTPLFSIKSCIQGKVCQCKSKCMAKIAEAQTGWILDGFPSNITQAQLLEKALGGFVEEEQSTEVNTFELVPNPELLKPPTPTLPVLDVALLLDISDECVIRRASSDKGGLHTLHTGSTMFCTGSTTFELDFIFYFFYGRIAAFQETWPELEKWYGEKQNILVNVNADVDEGELYSKVESALCEQVPEYLCSHWKDVCQSYVNGIKHVMQQLRLQLTLIDRHLFKIRYNHFLTCPDLKQELVSQWQKVFNSVPDDMREDEETKAELHLRLDELQERLWDITDKRKEEDKQERSAFMYDGWLEEQSALLINHYSMIIQMSIVVVIKCEKYLGVLNATRCFKRVLCTECFNFSVSSIDQLGEVVRHHIEASSKLQYELVMEDRDFYLNGDCLLVPGVVLPPRPPPVERPNRSILTVAQLESLFNHLFNMAPSGSCVHQRLIGLLLNLVSNSSGRSIVPEAWTDMIEMQLLEINFLLTDECELIDWRRFLLSATLPWPLPSLSQLLYLLKQYKETDIDDTGYISEEQYLQIELWFSGQSVQKVPEDPLEPLPYDRSRNLQKFFFQMFADHSFSPPLLDYLSMLQYFAASPIPKQGFIRALSVVLGKHLQQPLLSLLVNVIFLSLPSVKNLENVYTEMGYECNESVPFSVICKHPYTQMLMETSTNFQLIVSFCKFFSMLIYLLISRHHICK